MTLHVEPIIIGTIQGLIVYTAVHVTAKIASNPRAQAIIAHHQKRASGQGHQPESVIVCQDDECTLI